MALGLQRRKLSRYGTRISVREALWRIGKVLIGVAVPPPPKKEFTDEELSKKYGIHLASRLGSDDASNKEAKWADIDDDDDDWVPTTIAWNDGVGVAEEQEPVKPEPAPAKEPEPVKETVTTAPPPPQSMPPPPIRLTTTTATKEPSLGPSGPKTLVTHKPSSVKPLQTTTSAAPRASPWAKIAAPVAVPPGPVNSQPSRPYEHQRPFEYQRQFERRDDYSRDSHSVKEVSAEVYDRSWRDNSVQNNRELFNSHTGKMEPVQDSQRPMRSPVPKPAVLQRPSGYQQSSGPAEPSAAFQTGRSSHRPDEYRRRRTSSNVSGGSGSIGGRRPSFTRYGADAPTPDDMGFAHNRPMYSSPFDDGPPPTRNYAGYGLHQTPLHQGQSPTMANVIPVSRPGPPSVAAPPSVQSEDPPQQSPVVEAPPAQPEAPAEPEEDLIAKQARVMKEAREHARKRRQEEEEERQAATRERLKVKLEQLEKIANEKAEKEAAARKAEEDRIAAEKLVEDEKREAEKHRVAEQREQRERERVTELEAAKAAQTSSSTPSSTAPPGTSASVAPTHLSRGPFTLTDNNSNQRQTPNFSDRYVRQPPFMRSSSPSHPSYTQHQDSHISHPLTSSLYDSAQAANNSRPATNNRPPYDSRAGNQGMQDHRGWNAPDRHPDTASPWGAIGDGSRSTNNRPAGSYGNNTAPRHINAVQTQPIHHQPTGSNGSNTSAPPIDGRVKTPPPPGRFVGGRYYSGYDVERLNASKPAEPVEAQKVESPAVETKVEIQPTTHGETPIVPATHAVSNQVNDRRGTSPPVDGLRGPSPTFGNRRGPSPTFGNRRGPPQSGYNNSRYASTDNRRDTRRDTRRDFGGYNNRQRDQSPTSIGAGLSSVDRAAAVSAWGSLPDRIHVEEAEARERNRQARLAREAEEEATGIKKVIPTQVFQVTERFKEYGIKDDGSTTERRLMKQTVQQFTDEPSPATQALAPATPAVSKPSRFFPAENDEDKKDDLFVARVVSPPPPMSADHPVHGKDVKVRVNLPVSMTSQGRRFPEAVNPRTSDTSKFDVVQARILHAVGRDVPPTILAKAEGSPVVSNSKPSFEASPNKLATVSLPSKTTGGDSMQTIPDCEEFFSDLHQQDFGSTPTVRLPRVASYNAVAKVPVGAGKGAPKRPPKSVQSSIIFNPFEFKDFTNAEGSKFIPVQIPGGTYKEVPYRGQEKFIGRGYNNGGAKNYTGQGKKKGGRGGGNNGGSKGLSNTSSHNSSSSNLVYNYGRQDGKRVA